MRFWRPVHPITRLAGYRAQKILVVQVVEQFIFFRGSLNSITILGEINLNSGPLPKDWTRVTAGLEAES